MRTIEELIAVKRDGGSHSSDELERLIRAFVAGIMPDYQMAAWLMASCIRGLDERETVALTDVMARSGRQVDLSGVGRVCVDKHSTGGVADTTTLVVAPLVAACGVPVAKMSGRGLGHTGGTLDKLEAIPGFDTGLSVEEFVSQVSEIGIALAAQSADIDPADKKLYALRDVTATVPSIPLIVSSIISKKIAGGAEGILLDVKAGSGAFMKTEEGARDLAAELVRVGQALGRRVECVITDMNQPLGTAVGNALEVREAVRTLRGEGPQGLTEVCLVLAGKLIRMGGGAGSEGQGRVMAETALRDGRGLDMMRAWIRAQGGDARCVDEPERLPLSPVLRTVRADASGFLAEVDAESVGRAALALGAGRATIDARIDPGAGLTLPVRVGDHIEVGQVLALMYAAHDSLHDEAESRLRSALTLAKGPVSPPPLFHAA